VVAVEYYAEWCREHCAYLMGGFAVIDGEDYQIYPPYFLDGPTDESPAASDALGKLLVQISKKIDLAFDERERLVYGVA
jgi:hypothetical protein